MSAAVNQRAGIGRYARNIARELAGIATASSITWWYASAIGDSSLLSDLTDELVNSTHHKLASAHISRARVDQLHFRLGLPLRPLLNLPSAKVAYSPDFTVPWPRGSRRAMTIHDLAWRRYPHLAPVGLRRFLDRVVPAQLSNADRVFTVSESSKADILDQFQIHEDRLIVAPNAVEERFFSAERSNNLRVNGVSLPEEYLFMVGTIEPRKNHIGVLRAIERIPGCPILVIAGGRGWLDHEIMDSIRQAERAGKAIALGHVPDEFLPELYAGAAAVVAASWYEGFGLTVLEALAAPARVVASDIPPHREVAGQFACYVQPDDVESLANGIITALGMGIPTEYEAKLQQVWARRTSWRQSAGQVYETLHELL